MEPDSLLSKKIPKAVYLIFYKSHKRINCALTAFFMQLLIGLAKVIRKKMKKFKNKMITFTQVAHILGFPVLETQIYLAFQRILKDIVHMGSSPFPPFSSTVKQIPLPGAC